MSMQGEPDPDANPSQLTNAKQRIAPVAGVRTGDEGEAQLAAAQSAAATPAPAPAAEATAEAGGIDGAQVYSGLCQSCHEFALPAFPSAVVRICWRVSRQTAWTAW